MEILKKKIQVKSDDLSEFKCIWIEVMNFRILSLLKVLNFKELGNLIL
jgi:hypothetical protein